MAEFFFNRYVGTTITEPFSSLDSIDATTTSLLSGKSTSCPSTIPTLETVQTYTNAITTDTDKNTMYENAQCVLEKEHQTYLDKNQSETTIVGASNDATEKMSQVHMKAWHLVFGTGIMLGAVYTLTKSE